MNATATINIPIDTGLLLGILTDALEGGMSSWAQVQRYQWKRWYGESATTPSGVDWETVAPEVMEEGYVLLRVRNVEEDEEFVDITLPLLEASTQWALANYNHLFGFTVKGGRIDDMDYDAIGADVILQRAVIGEVLYG